ncbi:MAG: DUF4230 domain-containing protein [Aristaeellaceae bacterium]
MILIAVIVILGLMVAVGITTARVIRSRPVKFGLENIGELVTQSGYYTNVQVIEDWREVFGWQVPFTQSKYVYSYDGIIKAGVDFSLVSVTVDDLKHEIVMKLPDIKILSNEVDLDSLQVYDSRNNVFTPLEIDDVNEASKKMKEEAEKSAINNGLLESARENAEFLLRGFVASFFDMQNYTVRFV